MSEKSREILIAIKNFFDEGADCVYADALMFGDVRTLREHVNEAIEELQVKPGEIEVVKKRKIARNWHGNWVGFEGKRKVRDFGEQEEAALQWLWGV